MPLQSKRLDSAEANSLSDWPIVSSVLAFCGVSHLFLLQFGISRDVLRSAGTNGKLYLAMWLFILFGVILFRLAVDRPEKPFAHLRSNLLDRAFLERTFGFLGIGVCLVIFMPYFSAFKSAIPILNPFSWDQTFIELDRSLFFGNDAWTVLQPILGHPIITSALSGFYHLWVLLIYAGAVVIGIYQRNRLLRQRYFVAYFLTWSIVGILFAIIFSSVGPVFAKPILGIDTFDPQMAYLREADMHWPVLVLEVQQLLLEWHNSGSHGLGRGITAMPSMHIAQAFLFYLAMRHVSRFWAHASLVFLVLIYVGSIHLAYHYAVDGLVAAVLVIPIWYISGRIAKLPRRESFAWLGMPFWAILKGSRSQSYAR